MPRPAATTPTSAELEILQVFWERGASTVRAVHNVLKERRETGYSTTLKMIQVMTEKGLLHKDDSARPQIYRPVESEEKTQGQLLDHLIQRGFGGSALKLVMRALAPERISPAELTEAKRLIAQARRARS